MYFFLYLMICIFYVLFNRAYLRDVVEICHIFCKLMEHFCKGNVVVQKANKARRKTTTKKQKPVKKPQMTPEEIQVSCYKTIYEQVINYIWYGGKCVNILILLCKSDLFLKLVFQS